MELFNWKWNFSMQKYFFRLERDSFKQVFFSTEDETKAKILESGFLSKHETFFNWRLYFSKQKPVFSTQKRSLLSEHGSFSTENEHFLLRNNF